MPENYWKRRKRAASESGRKMANARWEKHRAEVDRQIATGNLPPREACRREEGELVGTLRFQAADGTVRSWTIRQGTRSNQIQIDGVKKPHGWDWFLQRLRQHLAPLTRQVTP